MIGTASTLTCNGIEVETQANGGRRKCVAGKRASGILLHPSSLPGRFGIGDLGPEAYRFPDFLAETGQSLWQHLPLGPSGYGNSPYMCFHQKYPQSYPDDFYVFCEKNAYWLEEYAHFMALKNAGFPSMRILQPVYQGFHDSAPPRRHLLVLGHELGGHRGNGTRGVSPFSWQLRGVDGAVRGRASTTRG